MVGRAVMLAGLSGYAAACFLPWVRSGQRERSAFELVETARSLDVLESGLLRTLVFALYLVPLATALCWLSVLLHRPRTATLLALATATLGLIIALSLEQAAAVDSLNGVRTAVIAALVVILGGALDLLESRREGRHGRRHDLAHEP